MQRPMTIAYRVVAVEVGEEVEGGVIVMGREISGLALGRQ